MLSPIEAALEGSENRNFTLKGQSHEKFGEMRARGLSLAHN
jgi:hypothetical protein